MAKIIGRASFRTFRSLWMLEELGIPYSHVAAWPKSEEVLRYNPLGKVPVFIDEDGFSMYESAAINTYLGDKYRAVNGSLVPLPGTHLRGLYEQTTSVITNELDSQALWIHRKHEAMGDIFTHIPDAVAHARKYFNKTNRTLINQLSDSGGPYLLGSEFTAADICYVHCLDWSQAIRWNDKWSGDPVVEKYLALCKGRPSYQKVAEMRRLEQKEAPNASSKL